MNATLSALRENINRVLIGKEEAVDLVLTALVCGGHALIEDVPGVGKTTLVQALAQSLGCSFRRIQFTPDVMPSDITGYTMIDMRTGERNFCPGEVMNQIILADEINRTGPKTQSALLEAMQEGHVTVDGVTHELPRPFHVFATQNPIEMGGTYALPEAQLDRFLLRVSMGYPQKADEISILERNLGQARTDVAQVAKAEDVLTLQDELNKMKCVRSVMGYIAEIAAQTRKHPDITLGVSPRGAIALMRAAMGHAMLAGRDYTTPDDVQAMLSPALAHRVILQPQARVQDKTPLSVLHMILKAVPVPAVSI